MASLRKKIIRGHPCHDAVRTARVDGHPRAIRQVHLGRADDIVRALTERAAPEARAVRAFDFGALAGLLHVVDRLKILETLDRRLPRTRKGMPSTGIYLLLAALNRAVDPRSKRGFAAWWKRTSLRRLFPKVREKHLTSQRFWDAMDRVAEAAMAAVGAEVVARMRQTQGPDLSCLLYDTTNFFTYIDTSNTRPKIHQRGYIKARHFDLRQVNLALLLTRDSHVPLFHRAHAGDRPDVASFTGIFQEITVRYAELLRVAVHGGEKPAISFTEDEVERRWLEERLFGKTVLMTSRDDWPTEEIARAYRGQARVEDAFRRMRRPQFMSWSPMRNGTDQKIRVHAFCCVLALLLLSLLHCEVKRAGRRYSLDGTMAKLSGIRAVVLLGKGRRGRGRRGRGLGVTTMLTERDRGQRSLARLLILQDDAAGATTARP